MNAVRNTILILITMVVMIKTHATTDTFKVYFATGIIKLNNIQQAQLDSLIYSISFGPNSSICLIGYADEPGAVALNQSIGQNRAQAVRSYLLGSGIRSESIVQCIGLGNLFKNGNDALQRRVDIVFAAGPNTLPGNIDEQQPTERNSGLNALATMQRGEVLVLEGVQFAVSTSEFLSESYPVLKRLAGVLKGHPGIKIKVEGHICCGPDPKSGLDYFFDLSVERAKHVRDYLLANQISADRLLYEGFGFSKPKVFPERSKRDRFRNRRVELRIVSN